MSKTTIPETITVLCEQCGEKHVGEYHHDSEFGGHPVYAVVCTEDYLTDWYTLAADLKGTGEFR